MAVLQDAALLPRAIKSKRFSWRTLMTDGRSQNIKDFVLPIGMVVSLTLGALSMGKALGTMTEKIGRLEQTVADLSKSSAPAEQMRMELELRSKIADLTRQQDDLGTKLRLLDDYTRGRIDRLPYRAPRLQ